ncbi:SixA phosphatase family protein [Desulfogranum mediterraneum]|uniref:SixA phosphatase family protein n=1 Tax=Desulfogranum mediterraneum TaxID=160661 RepID=UPI0004126F64|nr:histidine phosphatase family protein [Desulfogranum mediterraneum]
MKRLLLCRHAKSSWKDPDLSDVERPLNRRGKRDAPLMGRRLADLGIAVDALLSSPAVRARKTARLLARELAYPKGEISLLPGLYGASVATLVRIVHHLDNNWETVLLVGHNPEFALGAAFLGGIQLPHLPTSGVVALEFPCSDWQQLEQGSGRLLFFEYPKKRAPR